MGRGTANDQNKCIFPSTLQKLSTGVLQNQHYQGTVEGFIIHHYAGMVQYNVEGFCDRNRDVLFPDLIKLMQGSSKWV